MGLEDLDDEMFGRVSNEVRAGNYDKAVMILKGIRDKDKQLRVCYNVLACDGIGRAISEFGKVKVFDDREKYDRAKMGMEDVSPYAVLYVDANDNVEGLETMIDFVPEDNPLKQFFREIDEED